jgi:hypothetical protein
VRILLQNFFVSILPSAPLGRQFRCASLPPVSSNVRRRFAPTNGARAVEPSFERHPRGVTASSRPRVLAAPHRRNNSGGSRPGDGSAPGGMTLNARFVRSAIDGQTGSCYFPKRGET